MVVSPSERPPQPLRASLSRNNPVNCCFLNKPALFWTNSETSGAAICALMSTRPRYDGLPDRTIWRWQVKPSGAVRLRCSGTGHTPRPAPHLAWISAAVPGPIARCWPSRPVGDRWRASRLVATASENRLSQRLPRTERHGPSRQR
jgi:hypothetical protein